MTPQSNTMRILSSTLIALLGTTTLAAQEQARSQYSWPQWRGPARDGISRETKWRADGEAETLWSVDVGLGYSTVVVAAGKLYTQGHSKSEGQDTVYCLDAMTGEQQWRHRFAASTMAKFHPGGSLATPAIDGDRLFVASRQGKFFCLDTGTGKPRWHKDVVKEHQAKIPTWGLAASPMLLEDMVVLNAGRVLAFSRAGKLLWKSKDSGHAYSTPTWFEHRGKPRLAVFNGAGLVILDQKTGREIARSKWQTKYDVNAATPVVLGDKIFISSGYNRGCAMLQFDGKKLKSLWENREMRTQMSGCVAYQDHLFGFDEGTVKCLDLEGEVLWSKRGLGKGALVLAGDKLLMLSNRGQLAIAEASGEEYRELSKARVLKPGGIQWTTPVLCNGLVYCRSNRGQLVCVDRRVAEK